MRPALVIGVCLVSAFASAGSVSAHIGVTPGLLTVGGTQTLILTVHNDLDRPMTGLSVSVPSGVRIGLGDVGKRWEAIIDDGTARWTGGPLPANTGTTFEVELAVDAATPVGPVQLQAEQLYPGGGSLPWPIPVTVIPASDESSQRLTWAIAGALVVLATAGIGLIALRRRGRTLQEQ